jgi:hypothetical protein
VDEYIQVAKEKYGYNAEQALGMLFWHKHDLDKAIQVILITLRPETYFIQESILRLLNLQLQRQCCSRVKRFYIGEK